MRPTAASLSPDLLLSHADFVRRIARGLIGDADAADDVVQDTLVAALERPPRHEAGLRSWLGTVARNFARQSVRGTVRRRLRETAAAAPAHVPSTAEVLEREAMRHRVVQAVLGLPEQYRDVVLLRFYDDRPPRAIAALLTLPVETVRTRIKRSLERLRNDLGSGGERSDLRLGLGLLAGPRGRPCLPARSLPAWLAARGLIACALVALAIVGVMWAWPGGSPPPTPLPVGGMPVPASADPLAQRARPLRTEVPAPATAATTAAQRAASEPTDTVAGVVVDENGAPIARALVWLGGFERARGDEPFKPFKPARVRDGAKTDTAGRFTLSGAGDLVSVFHETWSPVTVTRDAASRVKLPALGAIAGRLVDPAGQPRGGVAIALDRERPVVTDADGRFRFDGAFSGVRGLCLPDKQFYGVTVRPRETAQVELGRDLVGVTVRLVGSERTAVPAEGIALIGTDEVFAVLVAKLERSELRLPHARPGRYWLVARGAPIALLDLRSPSCEAEVGTAELVVRAAPGRRVIVVPAGAHELLRVIAARPNPAAVGTDGTVSFRGLPAGSYEVVDAGSGRIHAVEVAAPVTEVRLP